MKRAALTASLLVVAAPLLAQEEMKMPQPSPAASVMQTVGTNEVTIKYHSPGVKGRKIWGDLVPMGQVWRTGANEATTITFTEDMTIGGKDLAAGTYSLFTIPGEKEWTIVLNKDPKQWGAYGHKDEDDVAKIMAKPGAAPMAERMSFRFADTGISSTTVVLNWERVEVSFPIKNKVDTAMRVLASLKEKIKAKPDDAEAYSNAANFCQQQNTNLDEAMTWIDQSIKLKSAMFNHFVKAEILKLKGMMKEAAGEYEKSVAAATKDDNATFKGEIESRLKALKAKLAKS